MFVPTYVMPAVLNVKNIRRWNTVNNVLKHVESVLRNVVKWQDKKTKVAMTVLCSFIYILIPRSEPYDVCRYLNVFTYQLSALG
jgi:hypothetical protein